MTSKGFDLGSAYGSVLLDASGVSAGIGAAKDAIDKGLNGMGEQFDRLGENLGNLGGAITKLTAPIGLALGFAINGAMDFDEAMTNSGAVLGKTQDQMKDLSNTILEMGAHTRAGPQAVAEAFYDITGGVADASTHMAILQAAIDTAEAGNADLGASTKGLISVMNAYNYTADEAATVSDVFTNTVGKGVGSMDEFVAAMSPIAGMTAQAGIGFDDLGSMIAYMTTKGTNASMSATQLKAAIVALLKPNKDMEAALEKIGVASGSAALKQWGLAGTLGRLQEAMGGSQDAMAGMLGSTEALQAATALNNAGFEDFIGTFNEGLDGATAKAKELQNASPAAQFDMLKSNIAAVGITLGQVLLPPLNNLIESLTPIIDQIASWINANPGLVQGIALVAGGLAVLGPILIGTGMAFGAIGTIVSTLGLPFLAIAGIAAALALAFSTNFLGIRDLVTPIIDNLKVLFDQFIGVLGAIWERIKPGLALMLDWFVHTGLPSIAGFISDHVTPVVNTLIDILKTVWEVVGPPLGDFFKWFTKDGLPKIQEIGQKLYDTVLKPIVDLLAGIWDTVGGALRLFGAWFHNNIPGIQKVVESLLGVFKDMINTIDKALSSLQNIQNSASTIGNGLANGQWNIGDVLRAAGNAIGSELSHHATGGMLSQGWNLLGDGGQPELVYSPDGSSGQVFTGSQTQQMMQGSGGNQIGPIYISANSYAEGQAAADGFGDRLGQLLNRRG